MPRPKNKAELLDLSQRNFQALKSFIGDLPENLQRKEFPEGTMNRTVADVLMHLHHWHLMMLDWYTIGMKGLKPEMPAKGYTWKTTPALNRWIWEKYTGTPLLKALADFNSSYEAVRTLVEKHSNEELFEKKRYKWTGTTSLGAYLISATSSHYEWALKLIKKAKKGA